MSGYSGLEIYARKWEVEGVPMKGVVVLLHGDLLWSDYFQNMAKALATKGYIIYAFDLPGYGNSGCVKGVERHVDSYVHYLTILEIVVKYAKKQDPSLPCFLCGEDLGGTIALAFAADQASAEHLAGIAVASPMLTLPPLDGSIASMKSQFFPLSPGPSWDLNYSFDDLFKSSEQIRQAEFVFHEHDPPTIRKLSELQKLCQFVKANMKNIKLPVLIMHGERDMRNDPTLSYALQAQIGSTSVFYRPYPDCQHGLFCDPDNVRFPLVDMQAWLSKQWNALKATNT